MTRILQSLLLVAFLGAAFQVINAQVEVAPGVILMATIQDTNINESSGLIPSRRGKGAYWTHNDGDDNIFAIDIKGRSLGNWTVGAAPTPVDFEDIAWSPGRIYAADIGNNDLLRPEVFVFAVPEPGPTFSGSLPNKGRWRLRYPNDERFDAEAFVIHRRTGYIIGKELVNGNAPVYSFPLRKRGGTFVMTRECELDVDDDVGGADLTRDGRRLAIITRTGAYLFDLPGAIPTSGELEPSLFVPFAL
ncbi:MAG TPA: hypothetical protein VK530_00350, partial [Candidatus Acidoferrum sp.]|nr:hypothetical protein [Candidatus Acidoferrum sp.]